MTATSGALELPPLGLGMAPIGKDPDADADAIVDVAWAGGIRYFDTAPLYGGGRSERRAGRALAGRPRETYLLSTKVGEYLEDGVRYIDHSYAKSMSSFDDSLDRLGVDRVDLLYVHAPGGRMAEVLAGAYPACEELRRQGRVTAVGAGVTSAGEGLEFVRSCDIDVLMLAGRYTLLDASAGGELLPLCLDRGIAVVTAGVFNSGILTGAPSETTYDYLPASHDILAAAGVLRDTCDRWGIPLGAVAMRFSALHPAVVSEVVGANTPGQLRQSIQWWRTDIPAGLWEELEAAGLVPPGTAAFATPADGAAA